MPTSTPPDIGQTSSNHADMTTHVSVVFAVRGNAADTSLDPTAIEAHQSKVLDEWFMEQDPLLTPEREREVRAKWRQRCASAANSEKAAGNGSRASDCLGDGKCRSDLPLAEVHEVLFLEEERAEYLLSDFVDDAGSFEAQLRSPGVMSLEEALGFLKAMQ